MPQQVETHGHTIEQTIRISDQYFIQEDHLSSRRWLTASKKIVLRIQLSKAVTSADLSQN